MLAALMPLHAHAEGGLPGSPQALRPELQAAAPAAALRELPPMTPSLSAGTASSRIDAPEAGGALWSPFSGTTAAGMAIAAPRRDDAEPPGDGPGGTPVLPLVLAGAAALGWWLLRRR